MFSRDSGESNYNTRIVSVPGGGVSKAVYFPIVPSEIGMVKLTVTAQAAQAGDGVEEPLRVEVCVSYIITSSSHFLWDLNPNSFLPA